MKKLLSLALILGSFASASVIAAEQGVYAGPKASILKIDVAGYDDAEPLGLVVGYHEDMQLGEIRGQYGVEFEMNKGSVDLTVSNVSHELDYKSMALYGVMRSEDPFYYKLKAGLAKEEFSNTVNGDLSDIGLAFGVGLGVRFENNVNVEIEYTTINADAETNLLSIGMTFSF